MEWLYGIDAHGVRRVCAKRFCGTRRYELPGV